MHRRLLIALFVLLALLLAACTGGDGETEELKARVAELEARLEATAAPATATPLATATPTQTPTPTATPTATSTPAPTAVPLSSPLVRYIGNTGGSGVSLRSACRDDAKVSGAWPEAAEVTVEQTGAGTCSGWSIARAGDATSWVNDQYLVRVPPKTPTPKAPPAAPSIVGTVWALYAEWMLSIPTPGYYPVLQTFLADGNMTITKGDGTDYEYDIAGWAQDGERVSFSVNNFSFHSGVISSNGMRMDGTAWNQRGDTTTWYAIRRR